MENNTHETYEEKDKRKEEEETFAIAWCEYDAFQDEFEYSESTEFPYFTKFCRLHNVMNEIKIWKKLNAKFNRIETSRPRFVSGGLCSGR